MSHLAGLSAGLRRRRISQNRDEAEQEAIAGRVEQSNNSDDKDRSTDARDAWSEGSLIA
jgi:hypothetical protein